MKKKHHLCICQKLLFTQNTIYYGTNIGIFMVFLCYNTFHHALLVASCRVILYHEDEYGEDVQSSWLPVCQNENGAMLSGNNTLEVDTLRSMGATTPELCSLTFKTPSRNLLNTSSANFYLSILHPEQGGVSNSTLKENNLYMLSLLF